MPTNLAGMMDQRNTAAMPARTVNRRPVQIAAIKLVFDPAIATTGENQPDQPPLSWKMSEREIRKIDEVWEVMAHTQNEQNPLRQKIFFSSPASGIPDLSIDDIFSPSSPANP